uniref:Uncharacterized protein n=2 Tax=Clastoptera arizonana TaxID=38151 RepID=A0A1B6CCF8_9HEMI
MSSTSNLWELTQTICQKTIKLRCFMALAPDTSDPITWLNGVIDIGTSNAIDQSVVIEELTTIFSRLHDHPSVWDWLLKLLGQIYNIVEKKQVGLNFLVNIFIIAVDWFSGYAFLGLNENFVFLRFPQAITHLVKCHGDSKLMAEWLKFLADQHDLDSRYPPMFSLAAKAILSNLVC